MLRCFSFFSLDAHPSENSSPPTKPKKQAAKVTKHLQKHAAGVQADEDGGADGAGGASKQQQHHGYLDDDNPFNDAALSSRFVWGKKIEREIRGGGDAAAMTARAAAQRAAERAEEIEKVKRRRLEREEEKAQREKEAVEAARVKAWEEGLELNRKEETFHLEQAKVRAAARLVDGRGTAADVLAKELHLLAPPWRLPAEASPPHLSWVRTDSGSLGATAAAAANTGDGSLSLEELKELVDDVRGWIELDCAEDASRRWWSSALVAAEDALADFLKTSSASSSSASAVPAATSDVGVHASVDVDVRAMLSGKGPSQLLELERGIRARLASGELPDPDYWAGVLRRIARARARAELGEMHRELVAVAVEACAAEDAAEAAEEEEARRRKSEGGGGAAAPLKPLPPPGSAAAAAASVLANAGIDRRNREAEQRRSLSPGGSGGAGGEEDREGEGERARKASAAAAAAAAERNDGRFSPPPLSSSEADALSASSSLGAFVELVDADDDARLRTYLRARARYHAARRLFAASVVAAASSSGSGPATGRSFNVDDEERDATSPSAIYRALALAHGSAADRAAALEEEEEDEGRGGAGAAGAAAAASAFRELAASAMAAAGGAGDFPFTADALSDVPFSSASHRRRAPVPSPLLDDDRYRPRKPLFHNRVHTGFDWNKYNSTHYSTDNPPPKVVQGYKFNIFYPDLLDPREPENAPKYSLERDPRAGPQGDTCLLRFSAGAPYDDLVFRIVNREWEYQRSRGFRCVFDRGILQLYFNFKRTFYRR